MILPRLYGRLGNQCFQISAAIAHAKRVGTNWRVPNRSADPNIWPTYYNNLPVARGAVSMHAYTEKRHCYDPIPMHRDMSLNGYFQSEKYFENAKPEIQDALKFDVNNSGYIAVHVRRGDYLQYPTQFPVLPIEYYIDAMFTMHDLHNPPKFFIYSDDLPWCKNWFNDHRLNQCADLDYCTISDPLAAMRHMYQASAFIISNSTFSLFPALLRSDNPKVIAPAEHRWYGPANAHLETCDLMPERFIKI